MSFSPVWSTLEPAGGSILIALMKSKFTFVILLLVFQASFTLAQGQEVPSPAPQPVLRGKIVDPSGAVLAGATVSLKSSDGTTLSTVRTDGQGAFSFTAPKPGTYSLEVSQSGFEKLVRKVELRNEPAVSLTLTLTIQKAASSVTVSANQRDTDYVAPESSTATKIELPILLTPQSVQVVPRAVIQDQKILTLDDATRNVSGVTTDFGFNGSSEPLLILRGFTSVSMTAMGAMSGSSTYYLDGTKVQGVPANMANVQSVEVVKGPDSVMYGRSEPGGLVNVVRRPLEEQPSFALELTGSNYSTARGLGEVSGALNSSHTLIGRLAGSWLQNRSNRDFVRDKVGAITGDIAWRPTSGTRLALMVDYTDQEYRTDYGIPADVSTGRPYDLPWSRQFNSSPELSNVRPFSTFFEASQRLSTNWSVSGKAAIVTADSHEVDVAPYRVDLTTGEDCIVRANELCRYYFNDRPRGQYRLLQENVELRGDVKTGAIRHQIVIGGDFYNSRKIGTMYLQQLAPINIFNPDFSPLPKLDPSQSIPLEEQDKNRWTSGVFQDNLTLTRKLHAVVALRLDGTSAIYDAPGVKPNEDFFATPRVGLVYEVANGHSIYAQYQDAVDTNNGRDPLTGKALAAERSREYEVGYKFASPSGGWTATLAAYQLTKRNRADFTLFPVVSVVGKARSRGIELDVLGRVTPKLASIISYGYTDAVVIDNGPYAGTFLANVPRHSGSTWLRYSIDKHWAAGAGVFAQTFRQGDIGNTFILPGYAREDAMVSYAFSTEKLRHEFQFNVNNLLDKRYYTGSHQFVQDWIRPGASRTFLLTYRVSR